ncbi:MAG TPA: Rrf2 family transcriptional regulator [Longimicrobium sp.]|nr:Rrf2 family transcriptional regulator [Longimicrobium sp.]
MRSDSRLARMCHVLIHMGLHGGTETSEVIARMLNTNPVVVRRTMAGLRNHGYVRSEKGHGGGWTLARGLDELTLLDVHRALGEPAVFAMGPSTDHPDCPVETSVNAAIVAALHDAEALLLARLGDTTLESLAQHLRPPA